MEQINASSIFSPATGFIQRGGFDFTCNPYLGCTFACSYCLAPQTPILHADLTWRPIGNVQVGDRLVGFDEYPGQTGKRLLREAVAEAVTVVTKPTLRLVTQRSEVVTTAGHGWLRKRRGNWQSTAQLKPGADLKWVGFAPDLPFTTDYRQGYLAGMTLGDGTMRFEPGWRSDKCGFPQSYWRVALKDVDALERIVEYLAHFGVEAHIRPFAEAVGTRARMLKVEVRSLARLAVIHGLVRAEIDSSAYRRGFLAGFFDAEGGNHDSLRLFQKDEALRRRVAGYIRLAGYEVREETYGSACPSLRLTGRRNIRWQFLSWLRPAIQRKATVWPGWEAEGIEDLVLAVEPGPVREVIDIQTSTRTFYAAGLATHNCYAAFLPQNRRPREDWGKWLVAKVNALELARRQAPRVAGKALYVSSVTDPYLPAERSLCLTRGILEELLAHQPRLLIQTRGPLVVRDIDVLQRFDRVRVNLSIPTDDEAVRQAFEPKAPPLERRWQALEDLKASGVPVGVCVTPMLPVRDPASFVERIAALGPAVVVTQDFHDAGGGFGADTGEAARALLAQSGWSAADYQACVERLRRRLTVYEAETGFFPPA